MDNERQYVSQDFDEAEMLSCLGAEDITDRSPDPSVSSTRTNFGDKVHDDEGESNDTTTSIEGDVRFVETGGLVQKFVRVEFKVATKVYCRHILPGFHSGDWNRSPESYVYAGKDEVGTILRVTAEQLEHLGRVIILNRQIDADDGFIDQSEVRR